MDGCCHTVSEALSEVGLSVMFDKKKKKNRGSKLLGQKGRQPGLSCLGLDHQIENHSPCGGHFHFPSLSLNECSRESYTIEL